MLSCLRLLLRGSTQGPYLWPMLNEKVSKRFYNKTVANKELHNSFFPEKWPRADNRIGQKCDFLVAFSFKFV